MIEYNIYAGPKGKERYLYTTLCEHIVDAQQIAMQERQLEYCSWRTNKDYSDALKEAVDYFYDNNLRVYSEGVKDKATEIYNNWLDTWGDWNIVETSQDNIAEEDLIRDYVLSDS